MELKLLPENHPILSQIADSWDFESDGDPSQLITEMGKIMLTNIGIGLAAIQVGIKKRIFLILKDTEIVAYINPEIIEGTGKQIGMEGCLSFPSLQLKVSRFQEIKVRYQNTSGETVYDILSGLYARVFQHELDHLNGICFVSKVTSLALSRAKEKRKKLRHSFYKSN